MREGLQKYIKAICMIMIVVGLVIGFFALILPAILLANEEAILKERLDNSIIHENYSNWKFSGIDHWGSFMIPNSWYISLDSSIVQITDNNGCDIAVGTFLGLSDSQFSSRKDFLEYVHNSAKLDITEKHIDGFVSINGSTFGELLVSDATGEKNYYYISLVSLLENQSAEMFVIFPSDSIEYDMLLDIAQAVIFSYCFPAEE